MGHKAGFVNIIGKPNVGKSTLMNELVGEKLSIITAKKQTTRHRILGIVNEDDYQIVFSDTPGYLKPDYKLQESMMKFVEDALLDADVFLFMTAADEKEEDDSIVKSLQKTEVPLIVVINKIDLSDQKKIEKLYEKWQKKLAPVYFLSDEREAGLQRSALASAISEAIPGFDRVSYPDWASLLARWWEAAQPGAVLALDEFPYMAKPSPELPSVLQRLLDMGREEVELS